MNQRPLGYVEDAAEFECLTPNKLLCGRSVVLSPLTALSEDTEWREVSHDALRKSYNYIVQSVQHFSKCFMKQYLCQLRVKSRGWRSTNSWTPKVGQVVLISSDYHRFLWPLAKVTEVYSGPDGHIRTVRVRTENDSLLRDPSVLLPLELDFPGEVHPNDSAAIMPAEEVPPVPEAVLTDGTSNVERVLDSPTPSTVSAEEDQSVRPRRQAAVAQRRYLQDLIHNDQL